MNSRSSLLTALVVTLVGAAAHTTHAQTWQTVDDFQHTAGLGATGGDIGTDASGNIFSVGSGTTTADGSGRVALIHVSADQGLNWITLPEFSEPGWSWAHYRAFTADASGRLYVGGNGRMAHWPSQDLGWIIRESVDGGASWAATDDLDGDTYAGCADIKVHPITGDVYAGGSSATFGRVIRKRAAGASEFTTVYSSGLSDGGSAWSFGFHPDGKVFVGGAGSVSSILSWITLRSPTGDLGSWTTVDTFRSTEWTQSSANATTITESGTIYVAGWGYSSKTRKRHWIVRTSTNGGSTWTISDNFSYGGATVELSGMTLDAAGRIFVCGQAANSAGNLYWLVRKGTPGTKLVRQGGKWVAVPTMTWTTSDAFQFAVGQPARANGITADASGNILVNGRAADATGVDHWIVRKLAP